MAADVQMQSHPAWPCASWPQIRAGLAAHGCTTHVPCLSARPGISRRSVTVGRVVQAPGKARQRGSGHDRMDRFLCGLAAGMIAKLGTHPLDVAKKRFQARLFCF